jgi:hypothetical protein
MKEYFKMFLKVVFVFATLICMVVGLIVLFVSVTETAQMFFQPGFVFRPAMVPLWGRWIIGFCLSAGSLAFLITYLTKERVVK